MLQTFADSSAADAISTSTAAPAVDQAASWARTTAPPRADAQTVPPDFQTPLVLGVGGPSRGEPTADGWSKGSAVPSTVTTPVPVVAAAPAAPIPAPRTASAPVIWPASGPITSYFGPSHPLGIDIGLNSGTPLRAVANGRIAFAGGDACCSYGYYVDIDHGNGVMTRYGHMLYVPALPVGTPVRQGDIIGLSGNTGFSTGPHVHFEVRLNGRVVDPLLVLPGS
ncbi:MAG: M23 family metallopeptidase [Dehalococcoidia bacterium]